MAIAPGIKGTPRLQLLRLHRLLEFQRVFDDYLVGNASAEDVRERAKKMLACGLPEFAAIGKESK